VVLDEAAVGRWDERLDEQRSDAADRGTVWGPILGTVTGADTAAPAAASDSDPDSEPEGDVEGGRFAAAATDAVAVVLEGLLADGSGAAESEGAIVTEARTRILETVAPGVEHQGTLGGYAFDRYGVASKRLVGVYERNGDAWAQRRAAVVEGTCRLGRGCAMTSLRR
jgi:hypothetical protein